VGEFEHAPWRRRTDFPYPAPRSGIKATAHGSGFRTETAVLLGISRPTLYRKLQAAGIDLDNTLY